MLESASGTEGRMKKSRFTEAQIAFALRQAESGTPVAEIIRKLGIAEQTFYRWKKRFAGMGVAVNGHPKDPDHLIGRRLG
jgi:transposase-like protein